MTKVMIQEEGILGSNRVKTLFITIVTYVHFFFMQNQLAVIIGVEEL